MAKETDKIVNKFKTLENKYWDMTPEERYNHLKTMLQGFSPNDEVRNKKK